MVRLFIQMSGLLAAT